MKSYAKYAKKQLGVLQEQIETALAQYLQSDFCTEAYNYHCVAAKAADIFKDVVTRPAKRLRGAFVLESYNMFSKKPSVEVMKAAVAIEVVHAYLLIIDDFNDRSNLRRGLPTAHRLHETYHIQHKMTGDALHYGYSQAAVSGLFGMHHASNLLLSMDFPPERLIRALQGVNDAINVTAYGQIRDIFNQQGPNTVEHDVLEVHRLKTAHYTYFNPLQLGATLAGETANSIARFNTYAENAGIAFQIQDDILGVYGDPKDTGKSNMDDIMEGKATLLTVYAYANATLAQKEILDKTLGNRELEKTPDLFAQVQQVIIDTGSLEHSKEVAQELVRKAKNSMYKEFPEYVENDGFKFIVGVADYMIERKL